MGELVRRLDYERRSKKNLSVECGSGQQINREYSAPVRAANDMEDRKCNLYVQSMEKHKQLFLDRYAYERKVVLKFKDELDAKSENFTEEKYQHVRAQSAAARLQRVNKSPYIGPIIEIIPRHLYRGESKSSAVKFDVTSDTSEEDSTGDEEDDEKVSNKYTDNGDTKEVAGFSTTLHWATLTRKPRSAELRRRRVSLAVDSHRFLPARGVRRQSAPTRVMSAYEPRDNRSSSMLSRRSSRSSLGGSVASLCEHVNSADDKHANSRSFRLLRDAFKKKRKEKSNPMLEQLNSVKADHLNKTCNLYEQTREKFDKLFRNNMLMYY